MNIEMLGVWDTEILEFLNAQTIGRDLRFATTPMAGLPLRYSPDGGTSTSLQPRWRDFHFVTASTGLMMPRQPAFLKGRRPEVIEITGFRLSHVEGSDSSKNDNKLIF